MSSEVAPDFSSLNTMASAVATDFSSLKKMGSEVALDLASGCLYYIISLLISYVF